MKSITYLLMTIASTFLVILLSLSACSPPPKTATTSPAMQLHANPSVLPSSLPTVLPNVLHSAQIADTTVQIRNFKFEPVNLTIAVGKTVKFTNSDEEPHTVTATDRAFDSKALDTNQTWNYTATKPGIFPYICAVHPFMKGTLTVTPQKI
jgi:plastocyanin